MYKNCSNLLNTKGKQLSFCLKLHEWINECPHSCAFFNEGDMVEIDKLIEESYDVECLHFSNRVTKDGHMFICNLFASESPSCDLCQFATYNDVGELRSLVRSRNG
ncbi:MAG: hypothetical protein ACTSW1_19140 [Candidatus Hodarchaeales archaeon]